MWATSSGPTVRPSYCRCLIASPGCTVFHIPVNDDGGEQVQPGHAVVLGLAGAVAEFALSPDVEGVLEGVMTLALVQAGVGPALHIGVEHQSTMKRVRSTRPISWSATASSCWRG